MVATIGPASYNYEETLTTLRYANRAKNIKNKPKINEDPKDALLRQFQEELEKLKRQLGGKGGGKKPRRRRNRRVNEDGEEIEDDEDQEDVENYEKQELEKYEKERTAIMANNSMIGL